MTTIMGLELEDIRICDLCKIQHEWGEIQEVTIFENLIKFCEKCLIDKIIKPYYI